MISGVKQQCSVFESCKALDDQHPYQPRAINLKIQSTVQLDWIYGCICEHGRSVSGIRKEVYGPLNGGNITIELPGDLSGLDFKIIGFYNKQDVAYCVEEASALLGLDCVQLSPISKQSFVE